MPAVGPDRGADDLLRRAVAVGVGGVDEIDAGVECRAMIRLDSASLVRSPNVIVPRQTGETSRPLSPSRR